MDLKTEKDVESLLCDCVRALGCEAHKMVSDPVRGGTPGLPDRLVIMADWHVLWVECKSPKALARYLKKRDAFLRDGNTDGCSRTEVRQFTQQQKLMDAGHEVMIVGNEDGIAEVQSTIAEFYEDIWR